MSERLQGQREGDGVDSRHSQYLASTLNEISSRARGDIEIEDIVDGVIDRQYVLGVDVDRGAQYILEAILEGLGMTGDIQAFFDDNGRLLPERREDARRTVEMEERINKANEWYSWHIGQFGRIKTGEKLLDDISFINEDWCETDLHRAFRTLADKTVADRTNHFANAVVKANRIAIIMMAQHTPGYTTTNDS
jgi:hypothetical protein